jgi:hypothetical protein
MGHRAYLIIRTEAGESELFEANNLLPFFWLTLLDQAALTQAEPDWEYASRAWMLDYTEQEKYADIWPRPTNLMVEKPALLENIAKAHRLLQASYPELLAAYQEFTRYVLAQVPGEDDHVQLDVFALSSFTSSAELLQSLRDQLAALDQQQPQKLGCLGSDLVQLTGFPSGGTAPGPAYPQLEALRAPPRPVPPAANQLDAAKRKRVWLPVAGLLLLQVSFMGYRHEGLTWLVAGLALLGASATAWGMARLLALLRRP